MKSEESPGQPELEGKIEDKQIDQLSLVEEVNKTEDKPDASSVPASVADSAKSQPDDQPTVEPIEQQAQEKPELKAVEKLPEGAPKMGDDFEPSVVADSAKSQPEDQRTIESVEKQPPQEQPAVEKEPAEEAPKLGDVTESVVADGTKIQPEEQPPSEYVEKQPQEQAPVEVVENQLEEQPKLGNTSEPSAEAVVKAEKDEVLLVKESETAAAKDGENSEVEPKREEEILEPVSKEEDKPQEQPKASKEVEKECAEIDPKDSVKVEIAKEEESLADKIEGLAAKESSDQSTPTIVGAQVNEKDDGQEIPPAAVTESANVDDKEREPSGINVVEELPKEEAAESGDVELESEARKNVKTEEEKKVITEGSDEPKGCEVVEDVNSSISPIEATEKSLEGDNTSRDVELVAENRDESTKKDEIVSLVKTEENGEMEEKLVESQKSEAEVKGGETAVQANETNLENEKEASEIAKPDVPKEEASKKPAKHSNNIMAKVKQSFVKAKKAITGKSSNSKPVSSETKGDIKEK